MKIVVGILADISISRSKALEIIKKTHSHSMLIINNIRGVTEKNIQFYSEDDVSEINQWYSYASDCTMSENLIFKELKTLNIYIETNTHPLYVAGTLSYDEMGDPLVHESLYALKLVALRQLFGKLFNIQSYF